LPSATVNTENANIESESTIACYSQSNEQLISESLDATEMNLEMKLNCPKEENINQKQSDHLQILK
jgi:activator of HSP90 ATPase